MNYTLNQLHIFLKVSQTESITKAAEELHLTQPAVSIQLKNFQNQFEMPLTEVIGRKLYITDFGKEIARSVEEIINQVQAINYKTLIYKGQLSGRLKLSVVSTGKYIMPYFLVDFLKMHPGIELVMDVTNKARVLESVEKNDVDFSLVSVLPTHLSIDNLELMKNKLFFVGGLGEFSESKVYETSLLTETPIIFREPGSGTRYTMEKYFEQRGLKVRKKMELTTNEAVKQAVVAGFGSSIMPLIGIKNELQNGELHIINMKGFPIVSTWNLIWQRQKKFSPVAMAFLEFLKTNKERIIEEKFSWFEQYL